MRFVSPYEIQHAIHNGISIGDGSIAISAGTLSTSRSDITFSNGSGVSFGLNTNGVITASVAAGAGLTNIKVSAGILSDLRSDITFSNSGGVSFGLNAAGVITATVATNYQSQGAYLTTAMASDASTAFPYLTTAQPPGAYLTTAMASDASSAFAGINGSIYGGSFTLNTSGATISLPAYLTTAQPPGAYLTTAMASDASSAFAGTGTTIAGGSMTVNTAGVNISLPAYLTTAALSGDTSKYAGTSTGMAGGSVTLNTDGISLSLPAYLTTAAATNITSDRAGTATSVVTTAGTDLSMALDTGGLTVAYPKWITTFSNDLTSQRAGTATSVVTTGGTDLSMALDTSGLTVAYPKWITTYVNDLTSQRAGTGTSVVTTGGTDLTMALDTSGLTVAYPKWITTYDATSIRAGTGTSVVTTAGTDLTMALDTAGLTVAYPKWITTYVNDLTSERAGTNTSVVTTSGTDLTCAVNTSGVTIAYPKWLTTAAATNVTSDRAGTNTGATGCSVTANTSGISVNVPTPAAPVTLSRFNNVTMFNASTTMAQSNSFYVFPFLLPQAISAGFIRFAASVNFTSTSLATTATNDATGTTTSGKFVQGFNMNFYSAGTGASSRSLVNVTSTVGGFTWQFSVSQQSTSRASQATIYHTLSYCKEGVITSTGTTINTTLTNTPIHSSHWTNMSASKWFDIPFAASLSAGNWYAAINRIISTTGGKNLDVNASIYCVSQTNLTFSPPDAASTLVGAAFGEVLGNWTTNVAATTASIGIDSISASTSYYIPWIQIERYA